MLSCKSIPLLIFGFLASLIHAYPQNNPNQNFLEVTKSNYDSCRKVKILVNKKVKKTAGKLVIPIANTKAKVFTDNKSDEDFTEFEYVGDIKESVFTLVKKSGYNNAEFFIINQTTGHTDTLIGMPIFSNNRKDFVCLSNPGTDEQQKIQICEIENGTVKAKLIFEGKKNTFFEDANCITHKSFLAKDNKGKYWRVGFTLFSNK